MEAVEVAQSRGAPLAGSGGGRDRGGGTGGCGGGGGVLAHASLPYIAMAIRFSSR